MSAAKGFYSLICLTHARLLCVQQGGQGLGRLCILYNLLSMPVSFFHPLTGMLSSSL